MLHADCAPRCSSACIATFVRLPYIYNLKHYKGDFLYKVSQIAILSSTEVGLGASAASAATLRPLVQRWLGERTTDLPQAPMGHGRVSLSRRGAEGGDGVAAPLDSTAKTQDVVRQETRAVKKAAWWDVSFLTTTTTTVVTRHSAALTPDQLASDEMMRAGDDHDSLEREGHAV